MGAISSFDPELFKAKTREQWERHATGWDAHRAQINRWLRNVTDEMLSTAGIRQGARVLDVAAGAGDQTLDILRQIGPSGQVLATDLSPAILTFAARRARDAGFHNLEIRAVDGERMGLEKAGFDAAVCRLGLMLMPDPARCLREIHSALRPGGRFSAVVFSGPQHNPCVRILVSRALEHAGLPPMDPAQPGGLLSLGEDGAMDALFARAGFNHVSTVAINAPFALPSTADYLAFVRSSASPIVQILDRLPQHARDSAWADISAELEMFQTASGWLGPNELLLTSGTRTA
jgi:SAM-dependent methyltransferase